MVPIKEKIYNREAIQRDGWNMDLICCVGPTKKKVLPNNKILPNVYHLANILGNTKNIVLKNKQPSPANPTITNKLNRFV